MNHSFKRVLLLGATLFSVHTFAAEANIPTLSTSGYGEMTVKPDMAIFTVTIQAERSQANQAKQAVDKVVTKLTSALNAKGIVRKDIRSGNLQISPQYNYPKDGKPVLNGYQAVRHITVNVEQLEQLNILLDASLAAGVNRVDNIQLKVKDESQYKVKARQAAIEDAKEKAAALAAGFDAELDGVWSIDYHNNTARPVVVAKAMMMESRSADQNYQDESLVISDQVDVVFKLKN